MKTLSLKILLIILLISGPNLMGQTITKGTLDGNVTELLYQFSKNDLLSTETRVYIVKEVVNTEDNALVDSASLKYTENIITEKKVLLDPYTINDIFPEVVSVGPNNDLSIDHNSLVAILVKALIEQQQVIDQLNLRISAIEQKITNK